MIQVRQASIDDIPNIMKFIDNHWRKGDVLSYDRNFFEWTFLRNGEVSIIIGEDDVTHEIFGIQGYLPYTNESRPDCAGTIWRATKCDDPLLGLHMADYMHEKISMRYYAGAGMRKRARRVAKINGGTVLAMDHFYRLNSTFNIEDYKIARVKNKLIPPVKQSGVEFTKIDSIDAFKAVIDEELLLNSVFRKDYGYIDRRYFKHPIYKYDIWHLHCKECKDDSVMITRTEYCLGSQVCKIIDFFGDYTYFALIGQMLDELLNQYNYEFIDVYSYGVDTELYKKGGMIFCNSESENIIPTYFQPYTPENIDIYLEKPWFDNLILFRGDGDQDRPVLIMEEKHDE